MQTPAPGKGQHQAPIKPEVQQAEKQLCRKGPTGSDGHKDISQKYFLAEKIEKWHPGLQ